MNETPFSDLFDEVTQQPEDCTPSVPLIDALDHTILQHRDVHFSGSFPAMISYYEEEGKGCHPEFFLERIYSLWEIEKQMGEPISGLCLTPHEQQEVVEAIGKYRALKELTENSDSALLADLILSEEEFPSTAIEAIEKRGEKMVPLLLELLGSDTMRDPLSPGYGMAPQAAAQALGVLQSTAAIRPLFEALDKAGFELEESCLSALYRIGEPAKDFLLKVLSSRPITPDNEKAALALANFKEDPAVQQEALQQLSDPATANHSGLQSYLQILAETSYTHS